MAACAKHPAVDTLLKCGRCDTYICPACSVYGPAGVRCRACSSMRSSHVYQVSPGRLLLAALANLAVCSIGGWCLSEAGGMGAFGQFWLALLLGMLSGETVLRIGGHKRGWLVNASTAASVLIGVGIGFAVWHLTGEPPNVTFLEPGSSGPTAGSLLGYAISAGVACASALARVRL